jgi:ABC-2 type transport system ATP-binding protein
VQQKSALISISGITKSFGDFKAVNGVSLDVLEGESLGLLGPNGAGKTTLISMLSTMLKPDSGSGKICGYDLLTEPQKIKQVVSVVPQDLALYMTLSAYENLSFFANLYGLRGQEKEDRIKEVLEIAQLHDWAHKKVGTYSGGMKRRINIAVGLLNRPRVLFLDEPTVGVDPQSRNHIFDSIRYLCKEVGMTLIYTTHYMEEAEELCDRVAIYDRGRVLDLERTTTLLKKHGEKNLHLKVELAGEDFINKLRAIPNVSVNYINGELIVQAENLVDVTEKVLGMARAEQLPVQSFNVHESNLETVFLKLTGKRLRD